MRVVKLGAALSLAGMAAFLYSIKQFHPSLRFEFTLGTVLIFLLAAVIVWSVCGLLFRAASSGGQPAPGHVLSRLKKPVARWLIAFAVVAILGTLAAFAYAVKDVSSSNLRDVIQGTLMALLTLTFVGVMFWRVVRFFEEESEIKSRDDQREE